MAEQSASASPEESSPLILLFSPREQIRSILTAGLLHANYRVIEASSSYVAGVKANQYLPDLVIVDITRNNIRDFLLLTRLERCMRTRNIPVLVSVTLEVRRGLDQIQRETTPSDGRGEKDERVHIVEYPFKLSELMKRIESVFSPADTGKPVKSGTGGICIDTAGERLFRSQVTVDTKFRDIQGTLKKQWAFPFTVIRALDIIGSDSSCCTELARCIESDTAATTAILELSNRVGFAKRSGRISSVREAVVRMGFRETRNILACFSLIDISEGPDRHDGFSRTAFWMHCLAAAIIAEKLVSSLKNFRPEVAFVTALIHDFGKIPLDNNFQNVFPQLLEATTNYITSFHETETRLMGFNHAELGHFLSTSWSFPSYITNAILNHHRSERILQTRIPSDRILQEAVFVSNIFAKAMSLGHSCDEILEEIPQKMLQDLHIPKGPGANFFPNVFSILRRYYDYLHLSEQHIVSLPSFIEEKSLEILLVHGTNSGFHPLLLSLRNNGYIVKTATTLPHTLPECIKVAIIIPDKGSPLDITINADDEGKETTPRLLKLFLLDGFDPTVAKKEFTKSNIVLMDRNRLDVRLVLHVIEDFHYAVTM